MEEDKEKDDAKERKKLETQYAYAALLLRDANYVAHMNSE